MDIWDLQPDQEYENRKRAGNMGLGICEQQPDRIRDRDRKLPCEWGEVLGMGTGTGNVDKTRNGIRDVDRDRE